MSEQVQVAWKLNEKVGTKALQASSADPKLGDGDYRFVIDQEPTFRMGLKEESNVRYAIFKLIPLADPKDGNSGAKWLAVSVWVACPETEDGQGAPLKRTAEAARFLRAVYGDSVPEWPRFGGKKSEPLRHAATEAVYDKFREIFNNPKIALDFVVDGRFKTLPSGYQVKNWTPESELRTLTPAWNYSAPVAV
jgi:hypothetical protein